MLDENQAPNINLFNFEEPFAENSKYVLTSPRSLKACEIIGVKPVELLHKPLSDFENDFKERLSYDLILERFQKREQERLRILRHCRVERSRIAKEIEEEQKTTATLKRTGEISDFIDDFEIEGNEDMASGVKRRTVKENPARWSLILDSSTDRDKVQRRLFQKDELRSPRDKSRPSSQVISGGLGQVYGNASPNSSSGIDSWSSLTESRPYISKESALRRHGWDEKYNQMKSRSVGRSPVTTKRGGKMQRTLSVDNILSDLPPHLQKGAAKLSDNDQRILNAMVAKANKEESDRAMRAAKKLELAEERDIEAELKQLKLRQHQMLLADKMRENERSRERHRRKLTEQSEERQRRIKSEIDSKDDYWLEEFSRQLQAKNNEVTMKRLQREEKKSRQEQKLARVMEEKEYMRNEVYMGLDDRHDTAAKNKELQIRLAKSKQYFRNMEEKQRHEERLEETKRRLIEDQKALQYAIDAKQRRAELNNRTFERQQSFNKSLNKMRSQSKKERQEESLKRMQNDLEIWQKELQRYQTQSKERASENAKKNAYLKGKKAMMDRLQKEHDHIINKSKIQEDEKLRLAELRNYLQLKDEKSKLVIEDKKDMAKASREAAQASRTMRDFIKEKTVKSSFDKMASEAEMMARIEKQGFRSSTKNISTMKIA